MPLVAPEMLGLPVRTGQGSGVVERSQHLFQQHLTQGDEEGCRRIVFDLYLAGVSLAKICDDVVAVTFQQIGHLWECGQLEIFRERQACEICKHVLLEWRMLLPPVPATQPLAIGGTPAGDPYELPSLMVDLVLKSQGWQTKNLGGNLPFNTLLEALEQLHPALFWLSVSHEHEIQNLEMELTQFLTKIPTDVRVVLGGRGVSAHNLAGWPRLERAQNMQELEKLVNSNPVV
jgi:methanogenic corrinoid protein MtbC1